MAELLGDSQGTPRTGGEFQHFSITVTARREQPEQATRQLLWTERWRAQAGAMREILEIDDLLHNPHDMELLDSIRWMDGREFKKRNRFFTQLIS